MASCAIKKVLAVSYNYSEWNVVILYSNVYSAPGSPAELWKEGHISKSSKTLIPYNYVHVAEILLWK